jgi:hypothetical protein
MQPVTSPGFILKDLTQHINFLWRSRDFVREHVLGALIQTCVERVVRALILVRSQPR